MGKDLLNWYRKNGRRFFWRIHRDPYTILIAEILLKKTGAETVNRFIPYFLECYKSVAEINEALEAELAHVLAPLGLSCQRAKQMKELASSLVQSYDCHIPCDKNELLKLPGIGTYTAGALLSFSFGRTEPIVDTNVARVITRVYELKPSRYEARRSPEVWEKATELVSAQPEKAARINWSLLDLGALVCRPKNPKHGDCPLKEYCIFHVTNITTLNGN